MIWIMNKLGKHYFNPIVRYCIAVIFLVATALAACQVEPNLEDVFQPAVKTETPRQTDEPLIQDYIIQPTSKSFYNQELVIWVPPFFDPDADHPASRLLKERLLSYQQENPQISIIVRVKSTLGPGSLLETLSNANTVAPNSLPALTLLSLADMTQAISKNLVVPLDNFSSVIDEEDWYGFAQNMGIQQGTIYGLPFVSNLLGIIYRQPVLESDQPDWNELFRRFHSIIFPAGDPEALITLSLYLSSGGEIRDSQGHQMMAPEELSDVLSVYFEASRRGIFSPDLIGLQSDDQAWEIFVNSESDAIITWANRVFSEGESYHLAILPSIGEQPYSSATGWLWCLTTVDEAQQQEAIKLAEYLIAPEFLMEWSPASGFFPVRPSSLNGWSESALKDTVSRMLQSAQPRPSRLLTSIISPELKNSIAEVITLQSTPEKGARKLIERLEVIETQ